MRGLGGECCGEGCGWMRGRVGGAGGGEEEEGSFDVRGELLTWGLEMPR